MNNGNLNGICNWNSIYDRHLSNAFKKSITYYRRYWIIKPWCSSSDSNDGWFETRSCSYFRGNAENYTDPLPQALILTAIVISFGVTAFFLVLAYRTYQELGTDNVEEMRGTEKDD